MRISPGKLLNLKSQQVIPVINTFLLSVAHVQLSILNSIAYTKKIQVTTYALKDLETTWTS